MTISVLATFVAKEGLSDTLKKELLHLLSPTRKEKGCINYDLHQSLDNQHEFFLYENWQSNELLDTHLQSSHIQQFIQKMPSLLAKPLEIKRAVLCDI